MALRRDVYLRTGSSRWQIEQHAGGGDGVSRFYDFSSDGEADDLVRWLLASGDEWRELPVRRLAS